MQTKDQSKRGRPSGYNDEIVDAILERLADGDSLRTICAGDGMPSRATVSRWLARYEEFRALYGFAREWQMQSLCEDAIVIADDCSVAIDRKEREISALMSRISRLAPKKYGTPRS